MYAVPDVETAFMLSRNKDCKEDCNYRGERGEDQNKLGEVSKGQIVQDL